MALYWLQRNKPGFPRGERTVLRLPTQAPVPLVLLLLSGGACGWVAQRHAPVSVASSQRDLLQELPRLTKNSISPPPEHIAAQLTRQRNGSVQGELFLNATQRERQKRVPLLPLALFDERKRLLTIQWVGTKFDIGVWPDAHFYALAAVHPYILTTSGPHAHTFVVQQPRLGLTIGRLRAFLSTSGHYKMAELDHACTIYLAFFNANGDLIGAATTYSTLAWNHIAVDTREDTLDQETSSPSLNLSPDDLRAHHSATFHEANWRGESYGYRFLKIAFSHHRTPPTH